MPEVAEPGFGRRNRPALAAFAGLVLHIRPYVDRAQAYP
jgi:hypothetical protein